MTLEEEIVESQSYFPDPPKNESNTCEWIILPLLQASGYARRDIESRMVDPTGQFPDYTLLPSDPSASFYLEAKAWKVPLEAIHAKQALNYANHNGKRFVVLTNGHVWQLYDNSIQGVLAEKLVDQVSLQDTAPFTDFMTILSKSEVLSGSLERQAQRVIERNKKQAIEKQERLQREEEAQRLRMRQTELRALLSSALPDQLNDHNSEISILITQWLNARDEYKYLASETLSDWFREMLSQPRQTWQTEAASHAPPQIRLPVLSLNQGERTLTLKEFAGSAINGQKIKPVSIQTPDGKQIPVHTWAKFAEQSVIWLSQQSTVLPVPFASGRSIHWFLNDAPEHKKPYASQQFGPISVKGRTVYMDKDQSPESYRRAIHSLCLAMKISPEEFRITIQG